MRIWDVNRDIKSDLTRFALLSYTVGQLNVLAHELN